MRRLLPGILIGLALGSTAAWTLAIPVTFPARAKAKLVGIVDEVGNVLFGTTPGKVEVMNFPVADQLFSRTLTTVVFPTPSPSAIVTTVPSDRALIVTDIDGRYSCGGEVCCLSDGSVCRLAWRSPETATPSSDHRSYSTGVRFGPGEAVVWAPYNVGQNVYGQVTVMGRLVPLP